VRSVAAVTMEEKGITRKTIEEMPPPPKIEVIQV